MNVTDTEWKARIAAENDRAFQDAVSQTRRTAEKLHEAVGGTIAYDARRLHALVTPPESESLFTFEGDLGIGIAFVVYQSIVTIKRLPSVSVEEAIAIYGMVADKGESP